MYSPSTYPNLLQEVESYGRPERHRGQDVLATQPLIFHFDAGQMVIRRGFNAQLAAVEGMCLIAGETDRDAIELAAPKTYEAGYFDESNVEYGEMYTSHVHEALDVCDHYSRRCVIFGANNNLELKDMPCATSIHLQVLHDRFLSITVFQRSWDLLKGLPYNVVMWGMAGYAWARAARLDDATIYIMASNPHVYREDLERELDTRAGFGHYDKTLLRNLGPEVRYQQASAKEVLSRWKDMKLNGTTYPPGDITQIPYLGVNSPRR